MANWWDDAPTVQPVAPAPVAAPAAAQMAPTPSSAVQWWADAPQVTFNAPDAPKPLTIKAGAPDPADGGDAGAAVGGGLISGVPIAGPYLQAGVERGIVAPLRMISHGESYNDALKAAQTFDQATEKNHPVASAAGKMGATALALAPAIAAAPAVFGAGEGALLGRMAMSGLSGGAIGGADAAVRSGGDLRDTAIGTGTGVAGGVIGPAIGAVAQRGITSAANYVAQQLALRPLGLSRPSADVLMQTMGADGSFTGQGAANIRAAGPDAMLVDSGPNAVQVLDTAMQKGGPALVEARQAIEDRAARAGADLNANLDRSFGSPQGMGTAAREIASDTEAARSAAYNAAYAQPIDYAHPIGQRLDELTQRVPASVFHDANRLMTLEGNQSQQIMLRELEDGTFETVHMPDVRQLDYVTRGLRNAAENADGQGKLGGTTDLGRAYGNLASQMRQLMRQSVPEYGTALDTAAEPIRAVQARDFGSKIFAPGTTRDEVSQAIARQSGAAEMQHTREGARQGLDDLFANVTRTATDPNVDAREGLAALRTLSSRAAREKVAMLVQDPGDAAALAASLERQAQAQALRAGVARNSASAARLMTNDTVKQATAPSWLDNLGAGKPLEAGKSIMQFLTETRPVDQAAREQRTYDELARAMIRRDPLAFLNRLAQANSTVSRVSNAVDRIPFRQAASTTALTAAPAVQAAMIQLLGGLGR